MSTPPEAMLAGNLSPSPRSRRARTQAGARRGGDAPEIVATDGELLQVFLRGAKGPHRGGSDGDENAFARLVERHGGMVWRVCRQVLPVRQDAEDAFQVTFLLLARKAGAIKASQSAAGWLYRVALRTAIAKKRQNRKRSETPLENHPLAPAETAFPDLAGRETASILMEELQQLPKKYQTPLVLRYLEGQSRRAIADQTDSTIATVQGQLVRGKKLLRSRLLRRGVSLSAAMAIVSGAAARAAEESLPFGQSSNLLVAQTTSNATALVTGGSITASVAVMSLMREGVRGMLVAQLSKPLMASALAAAVALLMTPAIASDTPGADASGSPVVKLNAEAPVETATQTPVVAVAQANDADQVQSGARAQPGTYVVVRGAAKPNQHGVSADGTFMLEATVDSAGMLALQIPGRGDGKLGGFLDTTTSATFPVNGKSPTEVRRAIADWLREKNIVNADEFPAKNEKNEPPIPVTVTLVEFPLLNIAEPGSRVVVQWKRMAHAANGEYLKSELSSATVTRDGIVALAFSAGSPLISPAPIPFKVRGMTKVQIKQVLQDYFKERKKVRAWVDRVDVSLPVTTPSQNLASTPGAKNSNPSSTETTTAPLATVNRPTPENGAVTEHYPNGQLKAERVYKNGRLVTAVEYSETGQSLYEMSDDGANQDQASPKASPADTNPYADEQPTEKERLLAQRKRLLAKWKQLQPYNQSISSSVQQSLTRAISSLDDRISRIVQKEVNIEQILNETNQLLESMESGAAESAKSGSPSPQKKLSKPERIFAQIEEHLKQLEAGAKMTDRLSQRAIESFRTETGGAGNLSEMLNELVRKNWQQTKEIGLRTNRLIAQALETSHAMAIEDESDAASDRLHEIMKELSAFERLRADLMSRNTKSLNAMGEAATAAQERREEANRKPDKPAEPSQAEPTTTAKLAPPKLDEYLASVSEALDRAEAEATKAERFADQALASRKADGSDKDSLITTQLVNLTHKSRGRATMHLQNAEQTLQKTLQRWLTAEGEPTDELPGTQRLESIRNRTQPLADRVKSVREKIDQAASMTVHRRHRFVLDQGVTGSNWEVHDQPSEHNPDGWAVVAELASNGRAPIPVTSDGRPRPEIELVRGDDQSIFLKTDAQVEGAKVSGGGQAPWSFELKRDQPKVLSIAGVRVELVYQSTYRYPLRQPGKPRNAPPDTHFAKLLIKQVPVGTQPPSRSVPPSEPTTESQEN